MPNRRTAESQDHTPGAHGCRTVTSTAGTIDEALPPGEPQVRGPLRGVDHFLARPRQARGGNPVGMGRLPNLYSLGMIGSPRCQLMSSRNADGEQSFPNATAGLTVT